MEHDMSMCTCVGQLAHAEVESGNLGNCSELCSADLCLPVLALCTHMYVRVEAVCSQRSGCSCSHGQNSGHDRTGSSLNNVGFMLDYNLRSRLMAVEWHTINWAVYGIDSGLDVPAWHL